MAKIRREKSGGWFKRERSRISQEARNEPEATSTASKDKGIGRSQSIVLRSDDGSQKEEHKCENSQQSKQQDK